MRLDFFSKDQGMFSPFVVEQQINHCGPCSLSSCLFMLGIEVNQRDLACAAGVPFLKIILPGDIGGVDRYKIFGAIEQYGAVFQELSEVKKDGNIFIDKLINHLSETGPALLSIDNGRHWIAAVGYFSDKAKFVIYDPLQAKPFYLWGHKHLLSQCYFDDDAPFEYPAILISRKDGQKPAWRITEKWMKIHNRGSDCTAMAISSDLCDLVKNAYNGARLAAVMSDSTGENIPLSELIETYRSKVLDAILYWQEGSRKNTKKGLKDLYTDYVTCADACRLHIPISADHAAFVAGLTALFSAYWWGAEMG